MPELPEVETVCRGLRNFLNGQKIQKITVNVAKLREKMPEKMERTLLNKKVEKVERRGKYIIIFFHNYDKVWIIHLGMSGKINFFQKEKFLQQKHDHVVWETEDYFFAYNDPRKFGHMIITDKNNWQQQKSFINMGFEPFDQNLNSKILKQIFNRKNKISIKTALLDQSIIAGLGNIYISEILWDCKISPFKQAKDLDDIECQMIIESAKVILKKAIEAGGTTLKDHKKIDGSQGFFQNQCNAYGRNGQNCNHNDCNGIIVKAKQNGRSSFFCNVCQNLRPQNIILT